MDVEARQKNFYQITLVMGCSIEVASYVCYKTRFTGTEAALDFLLDCDENGKLMHPFIEKEAEPQEQDIERQDQFLMCHICNSGKDQHKVEKVT